MNPVAKFLILTGTVLILFGLLWQLGAKFGLGRLPGDMAIEKENFRFYFPLMSSVVLSVVLSLIVYFLRYLGR